jgi:6-phosphogluconolactonase
MRNDIEVNIAESPDNLARGVGRMLVSMVRNSGQGRFDIALSGGTTPGILFDQLASEYVGLPEWQRIHLWWGDERCVSPGEDESNFRMAHERLISRVPVPNANIHRIRGEADPVSEASRYADEIRKSLSMRGEWPVFDLILLGMGDDGHTASIFPDRMDLISSDSICAVAVHPVSGQKRITLTGNVINNASQVIIMVGGRRKANIVSRVMNNADQASALPVFHIQPKYGRLTWFLDSEAAALV